MEEALCVRRECGEPVCSSCGGSPVGEEARELLYLISRTKYREVENRPWEVDSIRDLLLTLTHYLEYHYEKRIRSFDLLESCVDGASADEAAQCREGDEGPDG